MARPRDDSRRRELAERACEVLAREGLGISAERLALALQIKRPTLLYYFPTYGDILECALLALLAEQGAFVAGRVDRETHPLRKLFARMVAIHEFHTLDGRRGDRALFLTQGIALQRGERVRDLLRAGSDFFEGERRALAEQIRAGIREGTVRPCDAEALVAMARTLIDGLSVERMFQTTDAPRVHAFFWDTVLAPLVITPVKPRRRTKGTT
jgi:AcrR family transcriptional regulator